MTINFRVTILISSIFCALLISLFLTFNLVLIKEFKGLEEQSINKNIARIHEGISILKKEVATKVVEWGAWDDTYNYIKNKNKQYENSNLSYESLDQLHLRHFLITDLKGKIINSIYLNKKAEEKETIDKIGMSVFEKINFEVLRSKKELSGIIDLNGNAFLFGAAPITNSSNDAPISGVILFTSDFDQVTYNKLEELTKNSLIVIANSEKNVNSVLKGNINEIFISGKNSFVLEKETIYGITAITDFFEHPIRAVVVKMDRKLMEEGYQARNLVTFYVLLFTLISLTLSLYYLRKIIINPLSLISNETRLIDKNQLNNKRVSLVGDNEINTLAVSINQMLDKIAKSHNEVREARLIADRANLAKTMFVARISHEIRNQTHGIRGINELLLKRDLPPQVRDLINMSNNASDGLVSIVSEIMDFTKAEAGELSYENIPCDIRKIAKEVMQVIATRLENKKQENKDCNIRLYNNISPDVPMTILSDPTKLKQVLMNILGNALKFTNTGYVGMSINTNILRKGVYSLNIEISDTGTGIPKDKQENIFEPFKQVNASDSRDHKGTGLGLAIVKSFIDGMNGTVEIDSDLGVGSTFHISFKIYSSEEFQHPLVKLNKETDLFVKQENTFLAEKSKDIDLLKHNLLFFGYHTQLITGNDITENKNKIIDAKLLIIDESIFHFESVFELINQRITKYPDRSTIILISPGNLKLKDKLHDLGLKDFIFTPVLADDIIWKYLDKFDEYKKLNSEVKEKKETIIYELDRKLNVLVADDIVTNKIILENYLISAGHNVTLVNDGTEVIQEFKKKNIDNRGDDAFDLIITDITMINMNGDVAASNVRTLEDQFLNGRRIPIIASTGHIFEEELERIKKAGIDHILPKPLTENDLLSLLDKVFGNDNQHHKG